MFIQILRSFLGPFVVILDFFAEKPEWLTVIFGSYLLVYGVARYQLSGIKKQTYRLIEELCRKWVEEHPDGTDEQLYDYFYPIWETELKKVRYLYIMNKYDLWPVSVTPKHVLVKIPLTPSYLRKYLLDPALVKIEEEQKALPSIYQRGRRKG